jgi:hypothetical protein
MKRQPFKKAIPIFMVIFFVLVGIAAFFSSGTVAK